MLEIRACEKKIEKGTLNRPEPTLQSDRIWRFRKTTSSGKMLTQNTGVGNCPFSTI
jgi:hypothetical protein